MKIFTKYYNICNIWYLETKIKKLIFWVFGLKENLIWKLKKIYKKIFEKPKVNKFSNLFEYKNQKKFFNIKKFEFLNLEIKKRTKYKKKVNNEF